MIHRQWHIVRFLLKEGSDCFQEDNTAVYELYVLSM